MKNQLQILTRVAIAFAIVLGSLCIASKLVISAPAEPAAEIEVAAADLEVWLEPGQGNEIKVLFRNNSGAAIQVLKPIDGSEDSWVMPYYSFSLTDDRGREFSRSMRCAMCGSPYAGTAWPDDYLVSIEPGQVYEHSGYLNYYFNEEQEYLVSFRYVFRPESEFLRDGKHGYPVGLWRGEASSKTIRVRLKPQPFTVG